MLHVQCLSRSNVRTSHQWATFVQPLIQWKSNNYYIFWVRVSSLNCPCNAHAQYCRLWPAPLYSTKNKAIHRQQHCCMLSAFEQEKFLTKGDISKTRQQSVPLEVQIPPPPPKKSFDVPSLPPRPNQRRDALQTLSSGYRPQFIKATSKSAILAAYWRWRQTTLDRAMVNRNLKPGQTVILVFKESKIRLL